LIVAEANEYLARAQLLATIGRLEAPLLVPDIQSYDPIANFERVARSGDIPLLTPALSGLDGLTSRDMTTDRPIRDPTGPLSNGGSVPLTTQAPPRLYAASLSLSPTRALSIRAYGSGRAATNKQLDEADTGAQSASIDISSKKIGHR
jgi:outer membrane protein/S-layer protein transport system outer membrane protein